MHRHLPKLIGVAAVAIPLLATAVSHCDAGLRSSSRDRRAAEAKFERAKAFLNPDCRSYDPAEGVKLLKVLSSEGYDEAQFRLGLCFIVGYGIPIDVDEGARILKLAADQGHAGAQYLFGKCYDDGLGVHKDQQQAIYYYKLSAAQDYPVALHTLGYCYLQGDGVVQDQDTAMQYTRRAADLGLLKAQYEVARFLLEGVNESKHADPDGLKYLKMAADQGHPMSAYLLADMKLDQDTEEESRECFRYMQFAAKHGDVRAQAWVGMLTRDGYGVEQDDAEGLRLLKLSAEQGSVLARMMLADIGEGDGTAPSKAELQAYYDDLRAKQVGEPAFWKVYKW